MSKTFEFGLEELNKIAEENPDNEEINVCEDHVHCRHCNWEVKKLFVRAETREQAIQLLLSGDAGQCGECYASMLAGED
jgi:hypothetical protein